jgi:glycerol uptake facilitator-like aquaporin
MVDVLYGDMKPTQFLLYTLCQTTGAIGGTILANIIFEEPITFSEKERYGYHLWISEIVATCTLILVIHGCIRTGQNAAVPTVVAGWVGGGYFFTSSTIFANPAVTIGRTFSDTFAGINPKSMAVFIPMQIIGALLGFALVHLFYPPHIHPASKDDNLYRRVCVFGLKEFIEKSSY